MRNAPAISTPSERVIGLLATAIKVLVSLQYERTITPTAARDIARTHSLTSALHELGKGFETHRDLGDTPAITTLVAAEVAILGSTPPRQETIDAIRTIRQTA